MNFTALVLPQSFRLFGWLGLAYLGWRWLMSGDWRNLADPGRQNLFLGATVAVLTLWQIRTGIRPGLGFHLYGISAMTLMFGFWRASFAGTLILLANALFGHGALGSLGFDVLLQAALPAAVSWGMLRLLERRLPNHFFIYVFGNAFFGTALAVASIGLATTAAMLLANAYSFDYLLHQYIPYATLFIGWAEAFSTGMAVTMMAVYRPQWLETFDDAKYIQNK